MSPFAPTDAFVYYSAGERLNAGHQLYALQPGDTVIASNPPFWTVPLLSPPLLGVIWRPFAMLGHAGMLTGWAFTAGSFLLALALVARRAPSTTILLVLVLALPVAWQLMLGNVNGIVALALVLCWEWRDRPAVAGSLVAFMVAVKVTPIILVWWLAVTGRWRAVAWFIWASVALLAVAALGAGVSSIWAYIDVMRHTTTAGSSDLSVAGWLRALGVPTGLAAVAPWGVVAAGMGCMWCFRSRPRISFALAIWILVLGSPVVQLYWFALPIVVLIAFPETRAHSQNPAPSSRAHPA